MCKQKPYPIGGPDPEIRGGGGVGVSKTPGLGENVTGCLPSGVILGFFLVVYLFLLKA